MAKQRHQVLQHGQANMASHRGWHILKFFRHKYNVISTARIRAGLLHACRNSSSSSAPPKEESKETTDLMSAVISAAQDRRTAYDALIQREQVDYERGRRHLANMMGEDPETFTQEDVNRSIRYLLPSGLFEKKARPIMQPPTEFYPPQKAAQFASDGRPFDFLFYTGKPNYYNLMHDTYAVLNKAIAIESSHIQRGTLEPTVERPDLARSEWIDKKALELMIVEQISDTDYSKFIGMLERILQQPYSKEVEEYVFKFRKDLVAILSREVIEPIQYDETGRAYAIGQGTRKEARAEVTLRDAGNGHVVVNGHGFLEYFSLVQHRIQIMFPLHFIGMVSRFDLECTVSGGGQSGQSGAIRLATSRALRSFVNEATVEKMRQAGLLTRDPRIKERKKPGQKGARKKFTWKKR